MSAVPEVAADKWLPLLEHSTHEVFDIMLGSKLELGQPEAITGVEFTAMVGLAGIICGVMSIRYHFSNRSEDIIGLFNAALDALGIPWTRSTKYIVSIYRKAATARLDEFVGPKAIAVPLNGVHYTA